ncbi:hypothetical protein BHE74_00058071 [Ensete ventricosum]|nr:hypothetical protein BHE74_00058071 [Ensete ventricosum]
MDGDSCLQWPGTGCQPGWNRKPTCCVDPLINSPEMDFLVEALETYDSVTGERVANCEPICRFLINPVKGLIGSTQSMISAAPPPTLIMISAHATACRSDRRLVRLLAQLELPSPERDAEVEDRLVSGLKPTSSTPSAPKVSSPALHADWSLQESVADAWICSSSQAIIPSETKSYSLDDIEEALVTKIGFSAVVVCTTEIGVLSQQYLLSGVRICVSADGRFLITCPFPRKSNCGSKVKFYPFTDDMLGRPRHPAADHIKLPSNKAIAQ